MNKLDQAMQEMLDAGQLHWYSTWRRDGSLYCGSDYVGKARVTADGWTITLRHSHCA